LQYSALQSGSESHLKPEITPSLSSGPSGPSGSSAIPLTVHSFHAPGSVQALIVTTLKIPLALLDRSKRDIRFAYAKYQGIHDAMRQINQMASAGSWTQKVPINDDFIEVFCSKSNYFRYYKKSFSHVSEHSAMQKWLQNNEDSPPDLEVWDSMKPTFENLQTILEEAKGGKRKGSKKEKGKGSKGKEKEGEKEKSSHKKGKGRAL
jgi:hypothetical protein